MPNIPEMQPLNKTTAAMRDIDKRITFDNSFPSCNIWLWKLQSEMLNEEKGSGHEENYWEYALQDEY